MPVPFDTNLVHILTKVTNTSRYAIQSFEIQFIYELQCILYGKLMIISHQFELKQTSFSIDRIALYVNILKSLSDKMKNHGVI